MKVVILAGGLGTRLSEYTKTIPKPMVKIKGIPIITYIINHYEKFGFNHFIIAAGYKKEVIKNYFKIYFPSTSVSMFSLSLIFFVLKFVISRV